MKALSSKQLLRASFAILFFLSLSFMACLQHFALTLPQKSPLADSLTDGLVVATGGQLRINEGLRLIEQGASSRMLITGVGKGISKASLTETFAKTNAQQNIFRGNALAARNWVQTHQLSSISLVTANYHMPRALLYFQRIMPDVAITSLPISPPDLQPKKWYANWPTAKLLMREYAKYLVVLIFS